MQRLEGFRLIISNFRHHAVSWTYGSKKIASNTMNSLKNAKGCYGRTISNYTCILLVI